MPSALAFVKRNTLTRDNWFDFNMNKIWFVTNFNRNFNLVFYWVHRIYCVRYTQCTRIHSNQLLCAECHVTNLKFAICKFCACLLFTASHWLTRLQQSLLVSHAPVQNDKLIINRHGKWNVHSKRNLRPFHRFHLIWHRVVIDFWDLWCSLFARFAKWFLNFRRGFFFCSSLNAMLAKC